MKEAVSLPLAVAGAPRHCRAPGPGQRPPGITGSGHLRACVWGAAPREEPSLSLTPSPSFLPGTEQVPEGERQNVPRDVLDRCPLEGSGVREASLHASKMLLTCPIHD